MEKVKIKTDFITLGQFIKFVGLVSQGSDLKGFIATNQIFVNGEFENRRGRKIYKNSIVKINELTFEVI